MFDKFAEYIQYLMPSAFKRQKKDNQLIIYAKVIGGLYDDLLQYILRLREETILETCSHEMLEIFGNDYDMPRMQGETNEMYRKRLQMKALIAESAGTQQGILYALTSVGYDRCTITPFYLTDPERWAEIKINVSTPSVDEDNPIVFSCIVAEVMKVKKASTLLHWRFYYPVWIWETDINSIRVAARFALFVQFWDCCIYNGQYRYDSTLQYDAKRNYNPRTALINGVYLHISQHVKYAGTVTRTYIRNNGSVKAAVRSQYSVSYWGCAVYNSVHRYDDTLRYDAVRRYELHMTTSEMLLFHTMQTVECIRYMLHIQFVNKEKVKAGYKNEYAVKEPVPAKKYKVWIEMDIFFPKERIDNIYVETYRNVKYYDGTLRYDGTAKYDALYRKEDIK